MAAAYRRSLLALVILVTAALAVGVFVPIGASAKSADQAKTGPSPAPSPTPTTSPTPGPAATRPPTASGSPTPGASTPAAVRNSIPSNPRTTAPVYPAKLHPSPALPHGPQLLEAASAAGAAHAGGNSASVQTLTTQNQAARAQGVDVADFQDNNGAIQWNMVASQYQFAFIKATEGNYYVNPFYASDSASARAAGLYVGAYEFATPDTTTGQAEADYFLQQSGYALKARTLFPMVDLETDPYDSSTPCYGLSPSGLVSWVASYSSTIQAALGVRPIIYTAASFWNKCAGGTAAFDLNPLWVASYGVSTPTLPAGFSTWAIWQYGVGTAAGITGPADLDTFNGTVAQLASQLTDPNGNLTASAPAITSPQRGRLDVIYRGAGGTVFDRVDQNGTLTTVSLGGVEAPGTSPAAVSWGPNRIDVFVEGSDDALWHDFWNGSAWSGWTSLGGVLGSSPTVASWGVNRLDVFVAGSGFIIWHISYSGSWSAWQRIGGSLAPGTAPSAVSWGPRRIDLFLTSSKNQLWHIDWAGSWSPWQDLGGILKSGPGAQSWGPDDLHVFGAGRNNGLWETYWPGASGWSPWQSLGGGLASAPSATTEGPGTVEVAVRGTNSSAWIKTWGTPGQAWSQWQSVGGSIQ